MELCIAQNLRTLRGRSQYTLEGLAEIINVSRQTVAKWENGESYPDITNLVRLTTLFHVTLDEFVLMPLENMTAEVPSGPDDSKVMGMLNVGENGAISIPEHVLNMFEIHCGENVLLLADKDQGIALVKCSQLDEEV